MVSDFIFIFWWEPIILKVNNHGLIRGYKQDEAVNYNIKSIIKLLKAIFNKKLLEENLVFLSEINNFVMSKS